MYSLANVFDLFPNEFARLRAGRFPFFPVALGAFKCPFLGHDGLLSDPWTGYKGKPHAPWDGPMLSLLGQIYRPG
jgi:hypothetical protein